MRIAKILIYILYNIIYTNLIGISNYIGIYMLYIEICFSLVPDGELSFFQGLPGRELANLRIWTTGPGERELANLGNLRPADHLP